MTSDKDIERGPEPPKMIQNPNGTYPVAIKNPAWEKWDEGRGSRLKAEMKGMDAIQKRFDAPPSYGLPPAYLLGSPKLNNFMDGLETAQGGPDNSHTTVIGHSYGSTVVGDASNKGDLSADDIVVAGSPGMLTGDADDLDVGKDHVWSEAASDDFVPAAWENRRAGRLQVGCRDLERHPLQRRIRPDRAVRRSVRRAPDGRRHQRTQRLLDA